MLGLNAMRRVHASFVSTEACPALAPLLQCDELQRLGCTTAGFRHRDRVSYDPSTVNTYHLLKRGSTFVLYERPSNAATSQSPYAEIVIDNHWSAVDGEHYFQWTKSEQQGWEFIVPSQPGALGERLVYWGTGVTRGVDGITRPKGQPGVKCDLIPSAPAS